MTDYKLLCDQLQALSQGAAEPVSILANASALVYEALDGLNWAGFYLFLRGHLCVGPFQGRPACTEIAPGSGVCGTAFQRGETVVVPDVHRFSGHIACDSASNSEIVVPLCVQGAPYGVLDLDSPLYDRFTEEDRTGLETFARTLEQILAQG